MKPSEKAFYHLGQLAYWACYVDPLLASRDAQIKELQEEAYRRGQLLATKDAEIERMDEYALWQKQRLSELEAENTGLKESLNTAEILIKEALGEF